MPSEADTCRKFVVPLLQAAGWDAEPHSIAEQRTVTDGRIVPVNSVGFWKFGTTCAKLNWNFGCMDTRSDDEFEFAIRKSCYFWSVPNFLRDSEA